jgi:hypothetical protein
MQQDVPIAADRLRDRKRDPLPKKGPMRRLWTRFPQKESSSVSALEQRMTCQVQRERGREQTNGRASTW